MNNISYYNSDRLIFWKTLKIKITNLKKEKKQLKLLCVHWKTCGMSLMVMDGTTAASLRALGNSLWIRES